MTTTLTYDPTMNAATVAAPTTSPVVTNTIGTTPTQGTTLYAAMNQWFNRPADQRFGSLEALHAAVTHHREMSVEVPNINLKSLRIAARSFGSDDTISREPVVVMEDGTESRFTPHAFGQLARRIGARADYLSTLPPELIADCMNYGLGMSEHDEDNFLVARNGARRLRAALSGKYTRIWNQDVTSRLIRLTQERPEWRPAPAGAKGSDDRGLYASNEDMFAFFVDNDRRVFESLPGGGLGRGFFVSNSEVGKGSFSITTFWYEYICQNHRVLGAQGVAELKIPHIGRADERAFEHIAGELTRYADASVKDDEAKIESARRFILGKTKEEALDRVFGLRLPGLGRKIADAAYTLAEKREDWYGAPNTAWGFTGAVTEIARDYPNASDRRDLEAAAGRILRLSA